MHSVVTRERATHVVLDDVSKAIIDQLQEDGRRAYATIGKAEGPWESLVEGDVVRKAVLAP